MRVRVLLVTVLLMLISRPALAQFRPVPVVEVLGPGATEGTVLVELSTELPAELECPWQHGGCGSDGWAQFRVRPCPPQLPCQEEGYADLDTQMDQAYAIAPVQVELLEGVDYTVWGQWTLSVFDLDPVTGCNAYLCVGFGDFASTHVSPTVSIDRASWGVAKARYVPDL